MTETENVRNCEAGRGKTRISGKIVRQYAHYFPVFMNSIGFGRKIRILSVSVLLIGGSLGRNGAVAEQSKARTCSSAAYQKALDDRFNSALGGLGELVVLRILNSHRPEREIVFYRNGTNAAMIHLRLGESMWAKMGSFEKTPNQEECLARVAKVTMDGGTAPVPQQVADALFSSFQRIDLTTDHCVRTRDGKCGVLNDPSFYEVILKGGKDRHKVSDTSGTEFASENTALLGWGRSVEAAVAAAENPPEPK